jgi:hypothetical protein
MATETKVRLVGPAEQASTEQGFNATLKGITLADLIQIKCLSGTSECLRISSAGRIGILHFAKGQLTHAATNDLLGEKAVLELLGWQTGDCEPLSLAPSPSASVHRSWQSLLLAYAQAADEAANADDEAELDASVDAAALDRSSALSVRLSKDGQVLGMVGPADELASATAYALYMVNYIGECLGLDAFAGCEMRAGETRTVLVMEGDGEVQAIQSTCETDVIEARSRVGL